MFLSGLGQISHLGQGIEALEAALAAQDSLPVKDAKILKAPEVQMPGTLPESVKRRMSRLSKMFYASLAEAASDFGRPLAGPRTGLIIGSAYCSLDMAIQFEKRIQLEGPAGASPMLFAGSVQNALASHLSISFGVEGPCSTVVSLQETTVGALQIAQDWILQDQVDQVLIGIGDEISEHHLYAVSDLSRVHELDGSLLKKYFGPPLGEGVVGFVLSRESHGKGVAFEKLQNWRNSQSSNAQALVGAMVVGDAFEVLIEALGARSEKQF